MTSVAIAIAFGAISLRPGPAQLVSEAISHYYYAGTLSGTIATTISAGDQVQTCLTTLQVSSPDRMYFEQKWPKSPQYSFKTISNGKHYVYPSPDSVGEDAQKRKYLVETLELHDRSILDYRGVYSVVAGMVADRSIPLDIIMGRDADLKVTNQLMSNYSDGGVRQYEDEDVNVVFCDVLHSLSSAFKMKGAFFITNSGDIRYFKVFGKIKDENSRPVDFSSEWVVKMKVNVKESIDTKLYNLDLVNN